MTTVNMKMMRNIKNKLTKLMIYFKDSLNKLKSKKMKMFWKIYQLINLLITMPIKYYLMVKPWLIFNNKIIQIKECTS